MANFYLDNSDLKHHLNHPLMKKFWWLYGNGITPMPKNTTMRPSISKTPWIVMKKCSK